MNKVPVHITIKRPDGIDDRGWYIVEGGREFWLDEYSLEQLFIQYDPHVYTFIISPAEPDEIPG